MPLPGAGTGEPVVTSNNPEIFTGGGRDTATARLATPSERTYNPRSCEICPIS
jgi:hypothetical protein